MLKIALKDLKLFFSDKRAVILTFLMPVILITLFSFMFGGIKSNKEKLKPSSLLLVDQDQTESTQKIIDQLTSAKNLEIKQMALNEAQDLIKIGKENAVLVFHKGFEESMKKGSNLLVELQYDEAQEISMGILYQALFPYLMKGINTQELGKNILENFDQQYPDMNQTTRKRIYQQIESNFLNFPTDNSDENGLKIKMTKLVGGTQQGNNPNLVHSVAGTSIMMLLFSVVALGASLLSEKEEGTLKRLLYSPLDPNRILFGKMLSGIVISIVQLIAMFFFASLVFGLNVGQNIPALILLIIITAFTCSSFGIFLASVAKSRQQVQSLATLIILSMSAIGGSMVPLSMMPAWMEKFSIFTVNYWAVQGFYDILWRGLPLGSIILMKIGVLFSIGLLMTFLSLKFFKKNILQLA